MVIGSKTVGANLWLSNSTPFPTDYPYPKRTILVAMEQTKVAALKSPTPPPGGAFLSAGPTPNPVQLGPPPGTPMGEGVLTNGVGMHMGEVMGNFDGNLLAWVKYDENGQSTIVYAGVDLDDEDQGVLYVVREGTIWEGYGDRVIIPNRSGKPTITDAVGERLIIQTEGGDTFYFDVPSGKFAPSLTATLPTMTPGPTLTPRVTSTPLSGDDVTNNPARAGNRPFNTDLKYLVESNGDIDWFRFHLRDTKTIQVKLSDVPTPYQMHIVYAGDVEYIGHATEYDKKDKTFVFENTLPGFYYVSVASLNNSFDPESTYTLRVSDYKFEWLPPLGKGKEYQIKTGRTIPVKFQVRQFDGEPIQDDSVKLSVINENDTILIGPIEADSNPNNGITINPQGKYNYNLSTKNLEPGQYVIRVTFDNVGGVNVHQFIIQGN